MSIESLLDQMQHTCSSYLHRLYLLSPRFIGRSIGTSGGIVHIEGDFNGVIITPWLVVGGRSITSCFEQQDVRSLLHEESDTDDLQDDIIIRGYPTSLGKANSICCS
ncbi:hypothetical protein L1887_24398 [Cichorium endivia]|nr:hypothetical protein L1887_24398 [Cichorium endivia]